MRGLATLFLVPALVLSASPRRGGPLNSAREAKQIAEQETSGIAVSARKIYLNGASSGWEVDVHMPNEERGWRCTIDSDSRMVKDKTRIPNPALSKRRR